MNIYILLFLISFSSVDVMLGQNKKNKDWKQLFNGKNLKGWDIKIAQHKLNENYKKTFYVDSNMLRVSYANYDKFDMQFGHIYYNTPYSYYKLKFQYRFVGAQLADAPNYADRNSGIMIHAQSAASNEINQYFPVSLELQFLAGKGEGNRPTGNVCTPGTQLYLNGKFNNAHCINSTSKTYPVNLWVNGIAEVYGDSLIRHIIEGDTVLTYTNATVGGGFVGGANNWKWANINDSTVWINKANTPLNKGYIALQAESQPIDFKELYLLNLEGCMDPKARNYKTYFIKPDNTKCKY